MRVPGKNDLPVISRLLAANGLPTDDLDHLDLSLFRVSGTDESLDAVGGLERCGDTALIRSVATAEQARGRGLARRMVQALEGLAADLGIGELYLLTETAEGFFEPLGYVECDRAEVPQAVRDSRQFSSLCPAGATVMRKPMADK